MIPLMPREGIWYHSILKRRILPGFRSERANESFGGLQNIGMPKSKECAVAASTIFMWEQMYYADSIFAQANLQPFISKKCSSEKAMQNFLLILAVSGLDIYLMQVSITLQCETYLPVYRLAGCRVIKGHLIKICFQEWIKFWIFMRPDFSEWSNKALKSYHVFLYDLFMPKGFELSYMFLQVGVIILQIQVANNLYHPRGPLNLFFFTRSHSRPPLRRPKNPSSLYSRPVPSPPTSYYFWSTGLIESCRSDGMSFLRLSHKTQYDFCLSLSLRSLTLRKPAATSRRPSGYSVEGFTWLGAKASCQQPCERASWGQNLQPQPLGDCRLQANCFTCRPWAKTAQLPN